MTIEHAGARRLEERGYVTLDSNGDGIIRLGPVPVGVEWAVERYGVHIDGGQAGNDGAICDVHRNRVSTTTLIDASGAAGQDISEPAVAVLLRAGETLVFAFSGGTASARAGAWLEGRY